MKVEAVCISAKKGTKKHPVDQIEVKIDHGIVGDAHAGNWHRQISLLAVESVDKMRKQIPDLKAGDFAENIMTQVIILYELPIDTRLKVGDTELEVTQIGKKCHSGCEIQSITGDCIMPREGIFCKVIKEGIIKAEDQIQILGE